ncbi:acyl carrier protein [Micromonospora lutea]|uniref:Carrier domain-containing protein n=1 Tax=Micromonospora lutea TaxID=419825 RepID=A0ABQ4IT12_9ACTN|nr:phosphopantetheine-binding protein [Micromonospora lutea]GIJ21044.1 hypothetical protein Vlu01_16680 [Micromonospora lutea]
MTEGVRPGAADTGVDLARLTDIITRVAGAIAPQPVHRAGLDDMLVGNLGYNSLRLIELAFALEDLLAIEPMSIEDALPISTVRELTRYAQTKILANGSPLPTLEVVEEYLANI